MTSSKVSRSNIARVSTRQAAITTSLYLILKMLYNFVLKVWSGNPRSACAIVQCIDSSVETWGPEVTEHLVHPNSSLDVFSCTQEGTAAQQLPVAHLCTKERGICGHARSREE